MKTNAIHWDFLGGYLSFNLFLIATEVAEELLLLKLLSLLIIVPFWRDVKIKVNYKISIIVSDIPSIIIIYGILVGNSETL